MRSIITVLRPSARDRLTASLPVTERVGRKWALIISNLVFIAGAVPMVAANHDLASMYAGRALTGWGCGVITATVPSYIAELSIPSIRGILTGLFEVTYQTGSLIGFWINYGINQNMDANSSASWRLPMAVQLIPAGALLVGGFFLHESPLWLYRKGRDEEGARVLVALRHLPLEHQYMQEEVDMIRARLADEASVAAGYGDGFFAYIRGSLFELSRKGMWNRLLLVFCSFSLQNMSGAAGKFPSLLPGRGRVSDLTVASFQPSTTTRPCCSAPLASPTWRCTPVFTAWSRQLPPSSSTALLSTYGAADGRLSSRHWPVRSVSGSLAPM